MIRHLGLGLMFGVAASMAQAADAPPLPSLALDPQTPDSIWHGLSVGTDIFGVAGKGTKGFFGGDVTASYDHVLPNAAILSVNAATGLTPGLAGFGPLQAYDFASMGTKIAYPIGRWTPYMMGDLILAKPNSRLGGSFSGLDSANDLFNSPEKLSVGGRVGAGFDYALTNHVTVGLSVSANRGIDAVFP